MIVFFKELLADILEESLGERARVRIFRFNEMTSDRPLRDLEIGIYHQDDAWVRNGKGTYQRNYRYQIVVAVKNLRDDDEIQNLVDGICYTILAARKQGHEFIIEKTDNLGIDDQSIWRYTIDLYVSLPTTKDTVNCDMTRLGLIFQDVEIILSPKY